MISVPDINAIIGFISLNVSAYENELKLNPKQVKLKFCNYQPLGAKISAVKIKDSQKKAEN